MTDATSKLDLCVRSLKSLSRNLSTKSPSHVADLYSATVGLLCHLKVDQTTLHSAWHENPEAPCPSPKQIPAITAVMQDPALFDALVGCLKASGTGIASGGDNDGGSRLGHHHHGAGSILLNSRKRANSVSSDDILSAKVMKLSHSPLPSTASRMYQHRNQAAASDAGANSEYSPKFNVPVAAATILYLSFSHLDHWPVPLVKAYAEDCFGPRLWVDDEKCKLLVENLRLVHKVKSDPATTTSTDVDMEDATLVQEASKVADSYSKILDFIIEDEAENDMTSPSQQQPRRGSLSSVASSQGPSTTTGTSTNNNSNSSFRRSNSRDETESTGGEQKKTKKKLTKAKAKAAKAKKSSGDDGSSSSGEEVEEVIVTTKSGGDDSVAPSPAKKGSKGRARSPVSPRMDESPSPARSKRRLYPVAQQKLNLERVRGRFFGVNRQQSHGAITSALSERLDAKAKQNSALLQALHLFTGVAGVRSLVAGNLEKWLQSPGLSGLARTLFTSTVKQIENVDPPKKADLEAIHKVLDMRLKTNQLSAHVENITAMASTVKSGTVARQMYHQLLSEVLSTMERGADGSGSDRLKMVGAVYSAVPKDLSADGIAASLLMIMGKSKGAGLDRTKAERKQRAKHLKHLLQLIAKQLGASFDICKLIEAFLSYNVKDASWSVEDEEDRARVMFQCVLLLVPPLPKESSRHPTKTNRKGVALSDTEAQTLKKKLTTARQLILTWFCSDYGPLFGTGTNVSSDGKVGAGFPDYRSALGGVDGKTGRPRWLNTARCLLFMENGESKVMQKFLRGSDAIEENDVSWYDERQRINRCFEYGCDFDDAMMWIVLKSASLEDGGISSQIALTLLEHLFECCSVQRRGSLNITDMMLAWEMYSLVVYEPPETVTIRRETTGAARDAPGSKFDDAEDMNGDNSKQDGLVVVSTGDLDLPQLAYPGMWWRVTILALVMCGVAPQQIGATIWEEHPTLRAMIKMVISSRYRFPTVDCDENDRTDMKKQEQQMRDEESRIAEALFLPPRPVTSKDPETNKESHGRSRISARQQQKRERALKKKREKEAAEALMEENKRKKQLRAAQKTIILWDPTSTARKPPREAAELLVSVESHFALSKIFQQSVEPDFLLMTIGKTTRGAIERAYDWLIPIISTMPKTIARLHASASCVLLLRAYGTEGDERAQLKQLSAPLLHHVNESLTGRFGQADASRAFDLLMSDVASSNPDRRRCARRVLFDSIGQLDSTSGEKRSSWMLNILKLDHAAILVGDAIKHMSTAIVFERGEVLRNLLLALDELIAFAKKNEIEGNWDFASVFILLISRRPSVCAEALDRFSEIRTLGVKTVYEAFQKCIKASSDVESGNDIAITLCGEPKTDTMLSLPLLQAASVLLSIWKETNGAATKEEDGANASSSSKEDESEAAGFVSSLMNMLLRPIDTGESSQGPSDSSEEGLASAKIMESGSSAVSVESWIMLAKARSDTIARRAALTAPTGFLPRLLLCSGLPRASLLTMLDRLGKLGDAFNEKKAVFHRLLIPSATSEWDIGRLGQRREVARKLLGRLSAYLRLNNIEIDNSGISTSFLDWLSEECSSNEKPKKKQKHKSKTATTGMLLGASSLLQSMSGPDYVQATDFSAGDEVDFDLENFRTWDEPGGGGDIKGAAAKGKLKKAFENNRPDLLELVFREQAASQQAEKKPNLVLAIVGLQTFLSLEHQQDAVKRIVLNYVPKLSSLSGSPELWKTIFSIQEGVASEMLDALLSRCMASWCVDHISACCDWLLTMSKSMDRSKHCMRRITRFFVLSSGQMSVHLERFASKVPVRCVKNWGKSEDFVAACTSIAVEGMKQATEAGFNSSLVSRNYLPDWLVLMVALAKCGRMQMKHICESILQRISKPNEQISLPLLRAVFLRLYVCNPHGMNLGTALIRSVLMEAAQEYSVSWVDWRSPLDDQLQDMLDTVMNGSGQRLVRPLSDLSKKHPLLILRKCHVMTRFLQKDAEVGSLGSSNREPRGVIHSQNLKPLQAVLSGKSVKVDVKHWGYSYSEKIWIALLDILCAVPGPVLFGCGLNMGFLDFLHANMRLLFVQSQLRRTEHSNRLKDKLKEALGTFRKSNRSGWEKWLVSKDHGLPSLGELKNVLICCDLVEAKELVKT